MQEKDKKTLLATIVAVLVIVGIITLGIAIGRTQRTRSRIRCSHDPNLKTYAQWRQQVRFPYEAPPDKLQRVRKNYDRVTVGSSKDEVIAAFGLPDLEEELYPKEINGSCIGYDFRYYFAKPEEMANEFNDIQVNVFSLRLAK
jgi:hypothetical protein